MGDNEKFPAEVAQQFDQLMREKSAGRDIAGWNRNASPETLRKLSKLNEMMNEPVPATTELREAVESVVAEWNRIRAASARHADDARRRAMLDEAIRAVLAAAINVTRVYTADRQSAAGGQLAELIEAVRKYEVRLAAAESGRSGS